MEPEGHLRRKAMLNSLLLREVMDSDSESEKDDENDLDEPDPERPKKRVHELDNTRPQKRAKINRHLSGDREKGGGQKRKRQAKVVIEEADTGAEDLIDIIKQKAKAVQHAASKWVEQYELKANTALKELLATLFQACGVDKSGLEEFNWNDIDVDDAVQALVGQAKDVSSIFMTIALSRYGVRGH